MLDIGEMGIVTCQVVQTLRYPCGSQLLMAQFAAPVGAGVHSPLAYKRACNFLGFCSSCIEIRKLCGFAFGAVGEEY